MKLFSKEKGIIFSALNAILIIWIITAIVLAISNFSYIVIKEPVYSYQEYESINCDLEYETKEECERYYNSYKADVKYNDIEYKRSLIVSIANIVIVSSVIFILNKETKQKKK